MRLRIAITLCGQVLLAANLAATAQIHFAFNKDVVEVDAVAPNIVRVHIQPGGRATPRTLVMDPAFRPVGPGLVPVAVDGGERLTSSEMSVILHEQPTMDLEVKDAKGHLLLSVQDLVAQARSANIAMVHDEKEALYGMTGLDRDDSGASILRNGGATIAAGIQGSGGAPF